MQLEETSSGPKKTAVSPNPAGPVAPVAPPGQTTMLVPRKKNTAPTDSSASNPRTTSKAKNDKKRISPLTVQTAPIDSEPANRASKQNNIQNILAPMPPTPTAADANLMAARLDKPSNQRSSGNEELVQNVPVRHKNPSGGKSAPVTVDKAHRENGLPGKAETKKAMVDTVSLKRKRDNAASAAPVAVTKSREITPHPPKSLNDRYAS